MAHRGARARLDAVGPGGSDDPASARAVGGMGGHARRRPAAAERRPQGFAGAADGPARTRLPRLRQFPSLFEMESVADLFADRRVLRDPACGGAANAQGEWGTGPASLRAGEGITEPATSLWLHRRHRREAGLVDASRGEGGADAAGFPSGF